MKFLPESAESGILFHGHSEGDERTETETDGGFVFHPNLDELAARFAQLTKDR